MSPSDALTVALGEDKRILDTKLDSGEFASASDVVRAGLRALEREDATWDSRVREKVLEALGDEQPTTAADEVFARLRMRYSDDDPTGTDAA